MASRIDRKLLAQGQLHEGLVLATSDEREEAPDRSRARESLRPTSRAGFWSNLDRAGSPDLTSSCDYALRTSASTNEKSQQNQRRRIVRTDNGDNRPLSALRDPYHRGLRFHIAWTTRRKLAELAAIFPAVLASFAETRRNKVSMAKRVG